MLILCGYSVLQCSINFKLLYLWREGRDLRIAKKNLKKFLYGDLSSQDFDWKEKKQTQMSFFKKEKKKKRE